MAETSRTTAPVRFALELESRAAGGLADVDGGEAFGDVVVTVDADGARSKRLGSLQFSDISLELDGVPDPAMLDWVRATLARQFTAKDGAIDVVSSFDGVVKRLEFEHAVVREVRFPVLDGRSKDRARLEVVLAPELTRRVQGSGAHAAPTGATRSKRWLACNFRLHIDGLDCRRVSSIEPLVVKTVVPGIAVGEQRQYEKAPAELDCSDLVITIGEADADEIFRWHDDFVVRGRNDKSQEKNGTLELLDETLNRSLLTLELQGLGIHRLVTSSTAEGQRLVTASMYCHAVLVSGSTAPVGSSAATAPPATGTAAATEPPPATEPPAAAEPPPATEPPPAGEPPAAAEPPAATEDPATIVRPPVTADIPVAGPLSSEIPTRLRREPPPG